MLLHLIIRANETSHNCHYVHPPKSRVIIWRAARCLRLCERLRSPPSVMQSHLIVRVKEMRPSCHYILPAEVKNDSVESNKVNEAL